MRKASVLTSVFSILAVVAVSAQNPMRPGRWEVTMQMQMTNMPLQMPEMKSARCVTADELEDPQRAVPNASSNPANACKVSDYKTTGSTVTWKVACAPPQEMTGTGEMTFVGDTYTGLMKMVTQQGAMVMKMSGKRLGDCTP
jgi:hypothetical protein